MIDRTRLGLGLVLSVASLVLAGCPTEPQPRTPEDFGPPSAPDEHADIGGPAPPGKSDAPGISRSRGVKGGVLVFWPRVWPKTTNDATKQELANRVQQRLEMLAKRAAGPRTIDVRPDPERVCPLDGCTATTIGAVVVVREDACAVVAVVAGPGKSPGRILPWSGKVKLTRETVPFREPPEEEVKVEDFVPCSKLFDGAENRDAEISRAIAGLLPGG